MFFLNVFSSYGSIFFLIHVLNLWSSWPLTYKIQILFENVLSMILWAEEHMWEITESGEFLWTPLLPPISLLGLVQIGSGHILEQILCHRNTPQRGLRTATGTSKCTLPPPPSLAHPIAFGAWFLDSGSRSPYEFDLLYFNYMPPPPC